tara:strand:- start:5 stop:298 length:294 start_codon:yes stop_codon:yes gene_type:complete
MATKGTNAKIKELKGIKPEKVKDEELTSIQGVVGRINNTYVELGRLEALKHNHLHTLAGVQDELMVVQEKLKTEYGTDDINIQTGAIKYEDDVKADS